MKHTDKRISHGNGMQMQYRSRERKPWACCFYKLMLNPSIQSHKLRIPEKFATKFGDELSSVATLTVPTGVSRRVALVKEDSKLWLHDGWGEFVEYFSIGFAYFLLFIYEGNSNFKVHISDPTGCEVSYPCSSCNSSQVQNETYYGKLDPESSCKKEFNGDDNVSLKVVGKPSHKEKYSAADVADLNGENKINPFEGSKQISYRNDASKVTPSGSHVWLRKSEGLMKAVSAAGISMPENPFFAVALKPYAFKSQFLTVPIDFAREHFKCRHVKPLKVETSDGRQWLIKYYRRHGRCNLGIGWIIFARQNGLEVGDVCLFELTDAKDHMLKFHVAKKFKIRAAGQFS